jgi:hypothetical protein
MKTVIGKLMFLFLLLTLTGCMDQRLVIPTQPVREKADNYKLSQQQEVQVGDPILFSIDAKYYDGLVVDNDFTPVNKKNSHIRYAPVAFGQRWVVAGTMEDGSLVAHLPSKYMWQAGGTLLPEKYLMLTVDKDTKQVFGEVQILSNRFPAQPIKHLFYEHVADPKNVFKMDRFYAPGSKKKELIYNGKSKTNVKFLYREFVDALQEPKMQQDVQYDLLESNTINFQGFTVEVIEATNSLIKFKVVGVPRAK